MWPSLRVSACLAGGVSPGPDPDNPPEVPDLASGREVAGLVKRPQLPRARLGAPRVCSHGRTREGAPGGSRDRGGRTGVGVAVLRGRRGHQARPASHRPAKGLFRRWAHPSPRSRARAPGQAGQALRAAEVTQVDEERDAGDGSWKNKDRTQGPGLRSHGRTEGERGLSFRLGRGRGDDREHSVKGRGRGILEGFQCG